MGRDDAVRRAYNERYRHLIDFVTPVWGPDYTDGDSDIVDYRRHPHAEFVADFALPNGIVRSVSTYRPCDRYALCVARGTGERDFTRSDLNALLVLNRHFNNLVRLHRRLTTDIRREVARTPKDQKSGHRLGRDTAHTTQLSRAEADRCLARLKRVMEEEKAYVDPNLSLPRLARRLSVPRNALSELLNRRLGMGYSEYVNELRVAEASRRLAESTGRPNVLSVAFAVGFNSKTAFYEHFRKRVGRHPSRSGDEAEEIPER
jgi:AraC-like DNA-binding protein